MHHSDPSRPLIGGLPCIRNPLTGTFYSTTLPALMLSLRGSPPDHYFDLWGFFPSIQNSSSPKSVALPSLDAVRDAWEEWFNNPEEFAMSRMGWVPPDMQMAKVKVPVAASRGDELTLDDF